MSVISSRPSFTPCRCNCWPITWPYCVARMSISRVTSPRALRSNSRQHALPFRLPRLGLAQRTMLLLVAAVTGSLIVFALAFAMQRRADYTEFADARARAVAAQVHSTRLVLLSVPLAYRRSVSDGLRASGTV